MSSTVSDKKLESENSAPKVSVVIPAFNIAPYITETLASVFSQTYPNLEVIVVNDGSPDTLDFEREIQPFLAKIVYLKKENGGASSARNAAIKAASGSLIAFLDGDDVWLPDFLAEQVEFLRERRLDMVYADALIFGENASGEETYMQHSVSIGEVTTESLLAWECNVITSGTLVKREKLIAAGLFDETAAWRRGQDFEMWFRLAKLGARIGYQRKVLLKYRSRKGSLTGNHVQLAERNISVLAGIKSKYQLTPSEETVWKNQMAKSTAMYDVERGKAEILRGDFKAARQSFASANRFYRNTKLTLVGLMLTVAPKTLKKFFERRAGHLVEN